MTLSAQGNEQLPYLSNKERLSIYNRILSGCGHLFSKGHLQDGSSYDIKDGHGGYIPVQTEDKLSPLLNDLIPLTILDPIFLAHLVSYALKKTKNKDLQLLSILANSLSSADGLAFSPGSKYKKPNLRIVSIAGIQRLDPIMLNDLMVLYNHKFSVSNYLNQASHFPTGIQKAIKKYLKYRELNLYILEGARRFGMSSAIREIYRGVHMGPSDEAASVLKWPQRGKHLTFQKPFDFKGMTDLKIAEKIRKDKLPVLGILGSLPRSMSPVIAVALLEQCTGNQAVILRKTFEDAGVLKDKDVFALYAKKIATARTSLDRAKTLSEGASEAVRNLMLETRAKSRKDVLGDIGKVYLMIDSSGSMNTAFEVACERGSIIAEMVKNPLVNFKWGHYASGGYILPLPQEFVEDAFKAVLFGKRASGYTNAFSLYPNARAFGADVDIHISDGGHNVGSLADKIEEFHAAHLQLTKPKACVIIKLRDAYGRYSPVIKNAYEANGIPVAEVSPDTLTESALVAQTIKTAILGPVAVIDEILATRLLELPAWYFTI